MNIELEIWEDISNYEGLYKISNQGNVLSLEKKGPGRRIYPCKIMKPEIMKLGYHRIMLSKNGVTKKIMVHVLVARHFVPGEAENKEVNHIDGIKANNKAWNLEWVTKSDNIKHTYSKLGRIPSELRCKN